MIKRQSSKVIAAILLVCALVVSSVLFVTGCNGNNSVVEYTVVYDSQGGAAVKNGTYTEGSNFYLPTPSIGSDPKMYGYSFTGWFYDAECTKKAERALNTSYAKDGKITLYAGWSNVHKIYFDTRTSQVINPVEYAYGATVNSADLPVPDNRVVGATMCEFIAWAFTNTNEKISETFAMEAVDVYLFAVYDTGTNTRFELDEDGYYVPTGTDSKTTQTRVRDFELKNGQVYYVDMTLPADWSTYTDDSGPVFTAVEFNETGTTFTGNPYVTMFISCQKNFNGAIEFWGDVDTPAGTTTAAQLVARYTLDGEVLKGSAYEAKMREYQDSDEEATFTLSFRRVDGDSSTVSYYIGIDGIEYVCLTTGQKASRFDNVGNKDNVFSVKNVGTLVGLRAKTKNVKYSNVSVKNADAANVKFFAESGAEAIEEKSFEYGKAMGNLPVVTRQGFEFAGWYYTDYISGEKKGLTADTVITSDMYNVRAVAQWRKAGAKPYTVKFNTGIEGYTVDDVTGWYEGNEIKLPELSYSMMVFDGKWYYEAGCVNVVDFNDIDTAKADISGDADQPVLTIYAKASNKQFLDGEGTAESPFLVKTAADLNTIAEFVNSGETLAGYHIKLENDVVLSGLFTPIGTSTKVFSGNFDGNGKTISGLNVEGSSYLGLFGALHNATVKNLTIDGSVVGAKGANGILAGQIRSGTTVDNVTVKGSVIGGGSDNGGIAGNTAKDDTANAITVKNCVNYASVTTNITGTACAGGIFGATATKAQLIIIEKCKNYGAITSNGTFAGGIVGLFRACNGLDTKITGCYNFGDINGSFQVGGIVGGNRYVVENSYVLATAKINGSEAKTLPLDGATSPFVNAIVGRLENATAKRTGGGLCNENGNVVEVKVTAILVLDGGTLPEGVTSPVEVIVELPALAQLPVPVKAGYRFDRWELKVVSGEGEDQKISYEAITDDTVFYGPAHEAELVARYVEQVTLTIDADGGEYNGSTSIVIDKGGKLAAIPEAPAKEGFTFIGWFNGEKRITADDVYATDAVIKAHWEEAAQKSIVNFNSDGSLVTSKEVFVGDEVGELPVPSSKQGYRFDGWFDIDGKKITEKSTFEASVVEINAKWVLQTVITFNADGGSVAGETTKSIDAGTAIGELPVATIAVAGESFGGWVTADGKVVDETTVFGADATAITLYASFGWDGKTVSTALSGDGTENNPYVVLSGADLAFLASSVNGGNDYAGKYITIGKNINLNFKEWTPIGKTSAMFSGNFDGNGKAITAMSVSGESYLGLFGVLHNATVKNLTVDGNVKGTKGANGLLAGQIQSGTTVDNVTVKGSVIGGGSDNGGIAGNTAKDDTANAITVKNCVNYASVTTNITGTACAGGIFGATATKAQLIVIDNCKNYGAITTKGTFAGGIAGLFRNCINLDTKITGCYNFGDITGSLQVGGIVGGNRYVVENSYVLSTAKINGTEAKDLALDGTISPFVNAIVGRLENTTAKRTGGGLCNENGEPVTE